MIPWAHRVVVRIHFGRDKMRYGLLAAAFVTVVAGAQEPGQRYGSISGIVLDSLRNQPLADAEVSISPGGTRTRSDSEGRFSLGMIRPGKYDIVATHPFADSLGIRIAARGIELSAGQNAQVLLALPGESGTRRLICPGAGNGLEGSIRGRVTRTASSIAAAGSQVNLSWLEIALNAGTQPSFVKREISTLTDDAGYYSFCDLPEDFEGSIQAISGTDSTGLITVGLSWRPFGIALRPLLLPSTAAGRTPGRLDGEVVDSTGRTLAGAIIEIVGRTVSTRSRADGTFTLVNAPAGTRMVRVRKIGYFSSVVDMDINEQAGSPVRLTLHRPLPRLVDVVVREMATTVVEKTGFARRAYAGPGRYATRADLAKNPSRCVLDGIKFFVPRGRSMCSVSWRSTSMVGFRGVSTLMNLQPVQKGEGRPVAASSGSTACLNVYVDDIAEPHDMESTISLAWLDRREVVGMEYYSGASSPGRLRAGQCSVLLIWTIWYRGSHH